MLKKICAALLTLCLLLCGLPTALAEAEPDENLRDLLCALALEAGAQMAEIAPNAELYTNDEDVLAIVREFATTVEGAAPSSAMLYAIEPNGKAPAGDEATLQAYGTSLLRSYASAANNALGTRVAAAAGILARCGSSDWPLPQDFAAFAYVVELRYSEDAGVVTVFSDAGHGTMAVTAQALLNSAGNGLGFAMFCLANGFSCRAWPCGLKEIGAPGEYPSVAAEGLSDAPADLLAAAEEAARAVAIRTSDEYLQLTQVPEEIVDLIARCRPFAGTPERAYLWDMQPISLTMRVAMSISVGGLPPSMNDASLCSAMLSACLGQNSSMMAIAASGCIAYGTAYRTGSWSDDHARMVWLFFHDAETEEGAVLAVLFQPNGHGCVEVSTIALPEDSLAEALLEGDASIDMPIPGLSAWLAANKQALIAPEE